MEIPDCVLEAATLTSAGGLKVLAQGDYDGAIDRFIATLEIIRDARQAAVLAEPWQEMRLTGEVLPAELARMVNERKG